jgi:hypothetical protein
MSKNRTNPQSGMVTNSKLARGNGQETAAKTARSFDVGDFFPQALDVAFVPLDLVFERL